MKQKLTKRALDSLSFPDDASPSAQVVLWDTTLTGFGARVFPSGRKSFILKFQTDGGKSKVTTLGDASVLTVDNARNLAQKMLSDLAMTGTDPVEAKKAERIAGLTLEAFAPEYMKRHAIPNKRTAKEDARRLRAFVLPSLGQRIMKDFSRNDVDQWHKRIGEEHGPYEANRALALVSVMFEKAIEWEHLPDNTVNPTRRVKKFKEESRTRYLSKSELALFLQAVDEVVLDPYFRAYYRLNLLTGCRKSELLTLRWEQVTLEGEAPKIHLSHTKAGRAHDIPLTPQAVAILTDLQRNHRKPDNPFVFCSERNPGGHLVNVRKVLQRILEHAGLPDVRIHDLRRTTASLMVNSGANLHVVSRLLNHADISTTASHYAHLGQDPQRQALAVMDEFMEPAKDEGRDEGEG